MFFVRGYSQMPLTLHCEVKDPLALTVFLTTLRAYIEQTAPQMTRWDNADYQGQPYVNVLAVQADSAGNKWPIHVSYAATSNALIVSLQESALKRALDRYQSRTSGKTEKTSAATLASAWLGSNVCLRAAQPFLSVFLAQHRDQHRAPQQWRSWANLPILTEWKRRYPDQDPVQLHERLWGVKLVCPGGGTYVWNEPFRTMESTVFGHPGQPKTVTKPPLPLEGFSAIDFGLTFENQGLSAQTILRRTPQPTPP
jgi:hypothetical protein